MTLFLTTAAWLLLLVTCLPWLRVTHWTVRIFDFPRFQIAALSLLVMAGLVTLDTLMHSLARDMAVLACGVAFAAQGVQMWPYMPMARKQMLRARHSGDGQLSILNANVLMTNRNAEGLIEQVRHIHPHILLTLESDAWWGARLDEALGAEYVHNVKVPLDNLYGMHLFSRLPLEEVEVLWRVQRDIPSIRCWVRLEDGARIRLHALHPRPPSPTESDESLWRDAELLLVAKEIKQENVPALLVGDLNDVAWSRTTKLFCDTSGMLDPRRGRGTFSTFHAKWPFLRWPLDHAFASCDFTLVKLQRLEYFGSDHFPLLAELMYQPSRAAQQEEPHADAGERQEAQETIAAAHERMRGGEA